jgi:hypothetical protein
MQNQYAWLWQQQMGMTQQMQMPGLPPQSGMYGNPSMPPAVGFPPQQPPQQQQGMYPGQQQQQMMGMPPQQQPGMYGMQQQQQYPGQQPPPQNQFAANAIAAASYQQVPQQQPYLRPGSGLTVSLGSAYGPLMTPSVSQTSTPTHFPSHSQQQQPAPQYFTPRQYQSYAVPPASSQMTAFAHMSSSSSSSSSSPPHALDYPVYAPEGRGDERYFPLSQFRSNGSTTPPRHFQHRRVVQEQQSQQPQQRAYQEQSPNPAVPAVEYDNWKYRPAGSAFGEERDRGHQTQSSVPRTGIRQAVAGVILPRDDALQQQQQQRPVVTPSPPAVGGQDEDGRGGGGGGEGGGDNGVDEVTNGVMSLHVK